MKPTCRLSVLLVLCAPACVAPVNAADATGVRSTVATHGGDVALALASLESADAALQRVADEQRALEPDEEAAVRAHFAALGQTWKAMSLASKNIAAAHDGAEGGDGAAAAGSAGDAAAVQPVDPWEQARAWIDAMRALGDDASARQQQALAEVRTALAGADAQRQLSALLALSNVGDVVYDRTGLRDLILPIARSARGPALRAALYALYNTERRPEDLALVQASWARDPAGLSDSIIHLLASFGDNRLEGASEDITLEALANYRGENSGINGLWGTQVGPKLEQRLLDLAQSDDFEVRHGAIYFGLSTLQPKSPAVIDALLDALTDPDPNNSGRALWGLGTGVQAVDEARIVEALTTLYSRRSDAGTRRRCADLVARYGGDEASARLPK